MYPFDINKFLLVTDDIEEEEYRVNSDNVENDVTPVIHRQYEDYYEHVAKSSHIRPITVTEGVDFKSFSTSEKIKWWILTILNLLRNNVKTQHKSVQLIIKYF